MGAETKIEWTDHTVNFWWGCTRVGPGCDHCYAETWSRRVDGVGADGTSRLWGSGAPRRRIAGAPATLKRLKGGRVFIQSMSDLFDNEVPLDWFAEAWEHIKAATHVRPQLLTKRISLVEKRLAAIGETSWPAHAGLMISVVNQDEADRDVPRLLALKQRLAIPWVGLSMEPLLGPVDLSALNLNRPDGLSPDGLPHSLNALRGFEVVGSMFGPSPRVDWVIVGGESGAKARPMHPAWVRSLRDQCTEAGVPFFLKQWGEWLPVSSEDDGKDSYCIDIFDTLSSVFENTDRVRVMSAHHCEFARVGKKAAGRTLDGQIHDAMPPVQP